MGNLTSKTEAKQIKSKPVYEFIKRAIDIIGSVVGLVLFSPFFLIISIAIKVTSEGPVIFSHKRVGKNGKDIYIHKFRSMVKNAEELKAQFTPEQQAEYAANFKLENDPRVTPVGNFLRKTSLDEIPQLLNILTGDISIVGPRPVTEEETDTYGEYKDMLLSIKPGLTGYWAANGRSNITYEKRQEMEIYYVENRSLGLDIKIIFKTALSVIKRDGAK
ncbi:MAG: sugar transferase [Acutalibacteraceae bacterium]|nr:sugar transferase [Acutalibacteraceae bacterium]